MSSRHKTSQCTILHRPHPYAHTHLSTTHVDAPYLHIYLAHAYIITYGLHIHMQHTNIHTHLNHMYTYYTYTKPTNMYSTYTTHTYTPTDYMNRYITHGTYMHTLYTHTCKPHTHMRIMLECNSVADLLLYLSQSPAHTAEVHKVHSVHTVFPGTQWQQQGQSVLGIISARLRWPSFLFRNPRFRLCVVVTCTLLAWLAPCLWLRSPEEMSL